MKLQSDSNITRNILFVKMISKGEYYEKND